MWTKVRHAEPILETRTAWFITPKLETSVSSVTWKIFETTLGKHLTIP
jgi:hypothetical protein